MSSYQIYCTASVLCALLLGIATMVPMPAGTEAHLSGGWVAAGALVIAAGGLTLGFLALRHPGARWIPFGAILANALPLLILAVRLIAG